MKRFASLAPVLSLLPGFAVAGAPNEFALSPDITINTPKTIVADEDVVLGLLLFLGTLPSNAAVNAYHKFEGTDQLFSLDITVVLPGGLLVRPGDVVRFDSVQNEYSLEFDGQANGIPAGVGIDAVSADNSGNLILSFDVTVLLDGQAIADEDLVKFDGAGFELFFDASANGIDDGLDLDAVHFEPLSQLLVMSFDTGGSVAGTTFADEDLLFFNPSGGSWGLGFDGSANDEAWLTADLDATHAFLISDVIFYGGFESLINREPPAASQ